MEDRTESPMAVKVEEHSQCVILTYFQGDSSSMVDAHFTRALGRADKSGAAAAKAKKIRKSIKLEDVNTCQTGDMDSYTDSQVPPSAGHLLTFGSPNIGPGSWPSSSARLGEGPALPPLTYQLPPQGLSLTGQQYATSLLSVLHNDRGEVGPSMAFGSKPELLPGWSMPQGFMDPADSLNAVGFEHGRRQEKKDLYWY